MMTKTVVGTYRDIQTARNVVDDLVNAGFDRANISIVANDPDKHYSSYVDRNVDDTDDVAQGAGIGAAIGGIGGLLIGLGALAIPGIGPIVAAGPIAAALAGAGIGAVTGGIIGALVDLGIPEEEAQIYAESIRKGNVLVTAQVPDNRVDEASRIMERSGLIDLERHAEEWRAGGWTGFDTDTNRMSSTTPKSSTTSTSNIDRASTQQTGYVDAKGRSKPMSDKDDEKIEVVEEQVHIGKERVNEGGVRVRSYVREVPVEEEVRLREERVHVERRPVDRPASTADLNAFKEGTVEVTEMRERPVVSKEARVVEEVHIGKEVEERTEKVRDTARRTEVEVEQVGQGNRATTTATSYDIYDPDFRTHFQSNYAQLGSGFERYQPAYRYGYTLATDDRYRGRNWSDIEPEVHRAWEQRNQGTWENFKDAIQYSWDKVRGRA
jgi:uncharacterized protein (TIGR02271 family)